PRARCYHPLPAHTPNLVARWKNKTPNLGTAWRPPPAAGKPCDTGAPAPKSLADQAAVRDSRAAGSIPTRHAAATSAAVITDCQRRYGGMSEAVLSAV